MSAFFLIIIWLIITALAYYLVTLLPLKTPFPSIIQVIFVLLALYVILAGFGIIGGGLPSISHLKL